MTPPRAAAAPLARHRPGDAVRSAIALARAAGQPAAARLLGRLLSSPDGGLQARRRPGLALDLVFARQVARIRATGTGPAEVRR